MDDLPGWLAAWCLDHLGGEPAGVLFQLHQISMVFGLRLADGNDVVVKARDDDGRAVSCVAAQARLAERGFPCARPLTPVVGVGSLAVHAEEFRDGGDVLHGESPDVAVRYAEVFARLMAELADVAVAPPLPNPRWVRWDHTGSGPWPAIDFLDERDQSAVPAHVVATAERARGRLLAAGLPCVLGHADFEAQNLRWRGREVWAVHDWDSLAWQPEAALVGAASGAFARGVGLPTRRRSKVPRRSWWRIRTFGGACSRPWSRRSRGRPACGRRRTTPDGKSCTVNPRCAAMRSGHKRPSASAERMLSGPPRARAAGQRRRPVPPLLGSPAAPSGPTALTPPK
ncbi:hypothetical protein [Dactylosporangium sp. NPDC048998]|uniref:hypothetical protein n=1 Tax=Dactylosporangium sp. NPDC048998 TaxID=3363976 RepID=UPI003723B6E1